MEMLKQMYHTSAPRWFKVIRWKEWSRRQYEKQKFLSFAVYLPLFTFYHYNNANPMAYYLVVERPQTEEALMEMKQRTLDNPYQRDYEIDQYYNNIKPMYDLYERRQKYPEYYAGQYTGYKRYKSNVDVVIERDLRIAKEREAKRLKALEDARG